MSVIRLLPLAALPLMSACVVASVGVPDAPAAPVGPPPPPPLPIEVIEALPPGAPTQTVILDPTGCYIFTVEVTDPPSGYPVRDAAGTPLCVGNTGEPLYTNGYVAGAAPGVQAASTGPGGAPVIGAPLAEPGVGNQALAGGTSLAPGTIPDLGS